MLKRLGALMGVALVLSWSAGVGAQEHEAEHEAARLQLGLDLVLGFDAMPRPALPVVFASLNGIADPMPTQLYLPGSGVTESLLIAGSYELLPHWRAGARIGVGLGNHVTAGNGEYRPIATLSNLELEGEYELELSEATELSASLGVALPTASGAEIEARDFEALTRGEARTAVLQNVVQRAITASRGFEESALFDADRLGVIPKVALRHRMGALRFEAYVKLETLISTLSREENRVLVELITSGFAGYAIVPLLTAGVRVWGNLNFTESDESALMVEPQLRLDVGVLQASVGVITPLASPFHEPAIAGLRLTAAARF